MTTILRTRARSGLAVRLSLALLAAAAAGTAVVALPLVEAAPVSAAIRWALAGAAALLVLVVCAVGLFVSRTVTRPLREMRAAAWRMAEGEFVPRAPTEGARAIAELGRALNGMADALREKIQRLDGERARVAAILDSLVEGVIALDARDRILLVNPGARGLFELGTDPVDGRPLLEVVRQKELLDLVEACRAGGAGVHCQREIELGPPIGRTLEAHAVAVGFEPTRPGTLLVLHDVTELRRLERIKTEFVANVSHELRTPLTSIQGYLETLIDGALDDPVHARHFLEVANRHARRLRRLLDDLLQLSDIETGRAILKTAPVDLSEAVTDVAAIFEEAATRNGLVLRQEVPPGLLVRADRDRLTQILVNLVDNAVKYTPEGGRVTFAAGRQPDGAVEVRVTDTGAGIPSIDLPRITERFYRVDKSRSRADGGTGLGLAIVKHLVQAHGGELRIESELGKGTTVRVTLPAAPS